MFHIARLECVHDRLMSFAIQDFMKSIPAVFSTNFLMHYSLDDHVNGNAVVHTHVHQCNLCSRRIVSYA